MNRLDQIKVMLDQGVDIESISWESGRKVWGIVRVDRTAEDGVYVVTYLYKGRETIRAVTGYEVEAIRPRVAS